MIKPMLLPQIPITKELLPAGKSYYVQPKYDGIRLIVDPTDGIRTRSGKRIPATWLNDALWDTYIRSPFHGMVLDGEILMQSVTSDCWRSFNEIQSVVMSKTIPSQSVQECWAFVIFDEVFSHVPYRTRWDRLCRTGMLRFEGRLLLCETEYAETPDEVEEKCRAFVDAGYEGAVVRNPEGLYKQGRASFKSGTIWKYVDWIRDDARIIDVEEKMTNLDTSCKKLDNMIPANTLGSLRVTSLKFGIFNIGTGFTDAERQDLWNRRMELRGKRVMFKYRPGHIKDAPCPAVYVSIREEE